MISLLFRTLLLPASLDTCHKNTPRNARFQTLASLSLSTTTTMEAMRMKELTSGASGRIIPVFNSLSRAFIFIQSIFLSCFLLLRRNLLSSSSSTSPSSSERISVLRRRDDQEDTLRRRALAESLEMISGTEEENVCRWNTSIFFGVGKNALFCRSWIPISGEMKGIMIIIHGLNEHSGRYVHFARQLNSCSFGVYAMDWIGHGGSDGLHGYVPSLDHVVADTGAFLEKVKLENPGIPCFLFGHSTGGALVLKASCYPRIKCMLEGIVLTSPALRVKPVHPIVGAVVPLLSLFAPRFQFKGAKRRLPVSRDPAAMVAKYTDPLVYIGPIRFRTGHEVLRISSYLQQNMKSVTVPFLVLHGTADMVTDPLASQDLYNEAASEFKDIILYEGFLHDLLFEPEREDIAGDIINWMEKRLQSR